MSEVNITKNYIKITPYKTTLHNKYLLLTGKELINIQFKTIALLVFKLINNFLDYNHRSPVPNEEKYYCQTKFFKVENVYEHAFYLINDNKWK